jgi:hypothetical protein
MGALFFLAPIPLNVISKSSGAAVLNIDGIEAMNLENSSPDEWALHDHYPASLGAIIAVSRLAL